MRISNEMAQVIRDDLSTIERVGDAIIHFALQIPAEILKQGGRECRDYKKDIQRQLLQVHRIHSVSVRWTERGECVLQKEV